MVLVFARARLGGAVAAVPALPGLHARVVPGRVAAAGDRLDAVPGAGEHARPADRLDAGERAAVGSGRDARRARLQHRDGHLGEPGAGAEPAAGGADPGAGADPCRARRAAPRAGDGRGAGAAGPRGARHPGAGLHEHRRPGADRGRGTAARRRRRGRAAGADRGGRPGEPGRGPGHGRRVRAGGPGLGHARRGAASGWSSGSAGRPALATRLDTAAAGRRCGPEPKRGGRAAARRAGGAGQRAPARAATAVVLRVSRVGAGDSAQVSVHVEDDGVGFDPARRRPGSGWPGCASRAEEVGGAVDVVSAPGRARG